MRKTHDNMTPPPPPPPPVPTSSKLETASELADCFEDLSTTATATGSRSASGHNGGKNCRINPPATTASVKPAKTLSAPSASVVFSSSPRQPLDQSFLAFRAAGSSSTLLSGSSSASSIPLSSSSSCSTSTMSCLDAAAAAAADVDVLQDEADFVVSRAVVTNTSGSGLRRPGHAHHQHHHLLHHAAHTARAVPSAASKERYVFSNFRFLVKQSAHISAVDGPLDWLDIEMVLVPEIESHLCPICLDLPRFPRFTRCGHIYCLPCFLQYVQSSEPASSSSGMGSNWRSCPVCAEPVHLKQLRPVHFYPVTEVKVGQLLHTVLLEKPVGGLCPQPLLAKAADNCARSSAPSTLAEVSPFQRLVPVSERFVVEEIWTPELRQARQEWKQMGSEASWEATFMEATVNFIEERRREKLESIHASSSASASSSVGLHASNGGSSLHNSSATNQSNSPANPPSYYFHQSRDGLNVFLHPVCMKILFHQFHAYANIPAELSLPVLECERLIVDAWNRKRFKYLDHLPLGTQIILAEVDLSTCVGPETLATFSRELANRQQSRIQRSHHESSAAAHQHTRSILQEWQQMEDEYYLGMQASSAIDIVPPPEMVKLDDLADEASFPLPSSLRSGTSAASAATATAAFPRRPSIPSSHSFAAAAASPPALSFSQLASSLGTPFFYHNVASTESTTTTTTTTASASAPDLSCPSPGSSPKSSPSQSFAEALSPQSNSSSSSSSSGDPSSKGRKGKKAAAVLYSTNTMQRR